MNEEKNINKEFARLLHDSVMGTEKKEEILKQIESGEMDQDGLVELYTYLLAEEEVRKKKVPAAMEKIKEGQERMIESQLKNFKKQN